MCQSLSLDLSQTSLLSPTSCFRREKKKTNKQKKPQSLNMEHMCFSAGLWSGTGETGTVTGPLSLGLGLPSHLGPPGTATGPSLRPKSLNIHLWGLPFLQLSSFWASLHVWRLVLLAYENSEVPQCSSRVALEVGRRRMGGTFDVKIRNLLPPLLLGRHAQR